MQVSEPLIDAVVDVITTTLGIEGRASQLDAGTRLFGELPELDSLGVVQLATALEDRFGIVIADEDFTADLFETVGSLAEFVASKQGS